MSTLANTEEEVLAKLKQSTSSSDLIEATLKTDDRVLARVTDGIYRQPGSALRELISNAYDADATKVTITTDAPRFDRIEITDNGHGMTPEALSHVIHHIGGSAKRNLNGTELGVTSSTDPFKSPMGRKLIGKIGIGLFSVAQLTYKFQIITKVKNDNFRTIATVVLKQYSESIGGSEQDFQFESGKVKLWREKAIDTESQGTTIVLTNIRPQTKETLQSKEIWNALETNEEADQEDKEVLDITPPKFHVGRVTEEKDILKDFGDNKYNSLPWSKADTPTMAFKKLVDSVWSQIGPNNPNPDISKIFDYYLKMIWDLSLSVPIKYIDRHIFDFPVENEHFDCFELSNKFRRSRAESLASDKNTTIRSKLGLINKEENEFPFEVKIDDLLLSRPIKYTNLPKSAQHNLKKPLVFFGKCSEEFERIPVEFSGGKLSFEAYLFWNSKIAPSDHQGSLIRIHGASGTLFDTSFMDYRVAEATRLRQLTCEIFINEGLDGALNIDRESFNTSHPHCVFIKKWLHSALRQFASAQKRIAKEKNTIAKKAFQEASYDEIDSIVINTLQSTTSDEFVSPPKVLFDTELKSMKATESPQELASVSYVIKTEESKSEASSKKSTNSPLNQKKIKAIAQILASFGLLESLSDTKRDQLLIAISKVISTEGKS
ncbi:MAG: ATP-binding protein [Amphritea sp.]|nr:ATP-binding protein [Amphritea sp.]